MMARNLILVLGDQLSHQLASLKAADKAQDVVLMAELADETNYVRHHKKKIAFIFSAMRHFAAELSHAGWSVDYVKLDSPHSLGNFTDQVAAAIAQYRPDKIIVTQAGEWRVVQMIRRWPDLFGLPVAILPDDRFISSPDEFAQWAGGRSQLRMEYFYRDMRRKTGLLMDGAKPIGGQWNFDAENRKTPSPDFFMPQPKKTPIDGISQEVLDLVAARFESHFGDLEPFWFAVTTIDAQAAFDHFVQTALPHFGDYQDGMLADEPFLYHAVIAQYLNIGLLNPLEICRKVEAAYQAGAVPLNAAEGFIRQIIGWREYVRGIYWLKMPDYAGANYFDHKRLLPDFYWTAQTPLNCLSQAIGQTKTHAYAHHIQRLMVTGNFALLAGIDPHEVHEWYLSVYADAYEWVELPNTIGMSQFADGGLLASKPYIASGAYINRMSNYCDGCRFDVKQRTGKDACPFNSLYWAFIARHRDKIGANPRMGQMVRLYDKFSVGEKVAIDSTASGFLASL